MPDKVRWYTREGYPITGSTRSATGHYGPLGTPGLSPPTASPIGSIGASIILHVRESGGHFFLLDATGRHVSLEECRTAEARGYLTRGNDLAWELTERYAWNLHAMRKAWLKEQEVKSLTKGSLFR